ncbi:hypothetical protein ACTFIV_010138 [Dictyostelium citrinum]
MKLALLSLFLFNILLIVSSQQYDKFDFEISDCSPSSVTLEMGQCGTVCQKYAAVRSTSSLTYELSFYLDSGCNQQGYYNGTNIPFKIPFNCNLNVNPVGTDATVQCSKEPEPEPESESESPSSSSSNKIAVSSILVLAMLFLINTLL